MLAYANASSESFLLEWKTASVYFTNFCTRQFKISAT